MTNKEIIQKALPKAQAGGWNYLKVFKENKIIYKINDRGDLDAGKDGYAGFEIIIFHHGFAKAFWDEKEIVITVEDNELSPDPQPFMGGMINYHYNESGAIYFRISAWEYHLMQMVREKEPLKYLEKFL